MRKSRVVSLICIVTILMMLLTACQSGSPASNAPSQAPSTQAQTTAPASSESPVQTPAAPEPFGKYDPPITISTIKSIDSTRTYVAGESWDNNIWTKAYSEKLGINFTYLWTVDAKEFEQKMNIAIASDDLPDYMSLGYNQFYRLAKAGKLADITDAYNQYAYPVVKQYMDAVDNLGLTQCSVSGKLYGIGNVSSYSLNLLYYRGDWAANVGLAEKPKTMDDVIKLATAFAKNDPTKTGSKTVGFGVDQALWGNGMGLEGYFAAYGAYPTIWVDDGTGKLAFGAVQPNVKDVLAKLQTLYNDGIIDREFSLKGAWAEAHDDLINEKIGMVFGPYWFTDWVAADIIKKHGDKSPTWVAMPLPSADGTPVKSPVQATQNTIYCMKAGTKYPEAAVKLTNLSTYLLNDPATAEGQYHDVKDDKGNTVNTFFYAMGGIYLPNNYSQAAHVTDALSSGKVSALTAEEKSYYDRCKAYEDGTDLSGYGTYCIFGPGGSYSICDELIKSKAFKIDGYFGPNTDTMNAKLGNLISKRDEEFTKIIMGAPMSEFDNWLSYWNAQGGPKITNEVNEWYASK